MTEKYFERPKCIKHRNILKEQVKISFRVIFKNQKYFERVYGILCLKYHHEESRKIFIDRTKATSDMPKVQYPRRILYPSILGIYNVYSWETSL